MKKYLIAIIMFGFSFLFHQCEPAVLSDEVNAHGAVFGQVFSISHPGPIPEGWVPPKYQHICTVLVMNQRNDVVKEIFTNENGAFNFKIDAGLYYFGLRESPVKTVTGPFEVKKNQNVYVDVYYDNGMR